MITYLILNAESFRTFFLTMAFLVPLMLFFAAGIVGLELKDKKGGKKLFILAFVSLFGFGLIHAAIPVPELALAYKCKCVSME